MIMITRIFTKNLSLHFWQNGFNSRIASVLCSSYTTSVPSASDTEWKQIYKLPLVRLAAGFQKLKIYQAVVASIGTPSVFALEQAGHLPNYSGTVCAVVGVSGLLTLTLTSIPINNLIGIIYINSKENKVKLAFVDFWGRRKQDEIFIKDIVPNDDESRPWFKFYQPIRVHGKDRPTYKLVPKYSIIVDSYKFASIFGE